MEKRSQPIDVLRGIAIVSVIIWHAFAPHMMQWYPWSAKLFKLTWAGVDLFFVISGFLIGSILLRYRTSSSYFLAFYGRRFFRIFPLYAVTLIIAYLYGGTKEPFWALATFTQNVLWAIEGRFGDAWTGVTWSLAVEEQFYLVVPLLILLISPKQLPWVLIPLVIAAPLLRLAIWATGGGPFTSVYYAVYLMLPTRMDGLFLGVLLAWLLLEPRRSDWLMSHRVGVKSVSAILLLGCAAMSIAEWSSASRGMILGGYTWIALTAASVVLLAATTKRQVSVLLTPLAAAGIGCFSLYLLHIPLGVILLYSIDWAAFPLHPLPFFVARAISLVIAAYICWHLIEKPNIAIGHRLFPYRRLAPGSESRNAKQPASAG
ncbi:acyltransferase family protein [Aquibium oceanicum]|uniref:Acyltransferase 3 domain-containing protein n=1 Tax=Aquibium oceanicum TaxID=1670800 RepID=A0A1L3SQ49_9HYPH|nr:acyltransferase [Aquibium oceanicum]APH71490.1 hypothetical protein BSQ44_08990 [Aquibium oceanicum]